MTKFCLLSYRANHEECHKGSTVEFDCTSLVDYDQNDKAFYLVYVHKSTVEVDRTFMRYECSHWWYYGAGYNCVFGTTMELEAPGRVHISLAFAPPPLS